MTNVEIVDLDKILLPKLLGPTEKIERYETKRLTAAGENYGSLMLALNITIKNHQTNEERTLNAVAKLVPDNEFIQKMFKPWLTFRKELELYRTIVPTLQAFQREQGVEDVIDFFPEFYGGRLGLNGDDQFDSNAIILLENLKLSGYINVERTEGFDLATTKLILKDLAQFHAVPTALHLKKPEVFEEKIMPYIQPAKVFSGLPAELKDTVLEEVLKIAAEDSFCKKYLPEIEKAFRISQELFMEGSKPVRPFATIAHCDFWINNTLVKFEEGKPVKNRMVDFQVTEYVSPAKDLTFFLFDSIQNDLIDKFDDFVKEYFETFIDTLKRLNVDIKPFTLEAFEKEIEIMIKQNTLFHCLMMLPPIFAPRDSAKHAEQISLGDFEDKKERPLAHKVKLWIIIKECIKRKWI